MIAEHLGEVERRLMMSQKQTASASELLCREFCEPMFGSELCVAAGRIVDCASTPATPVASADLLVCLPNGPRLRLGDKTVGLLAESVVAAIFVLPTIDAEAMSRAVASARVIKALRRNGLHPAGAGPISALSAPLASGLTDAARAIPCHLVAFDGPAGMEEVHQWLKLAYREQGIAEPELPLTGAEREQIASPALDGVFVLGRGFLAFDNSLLSLFDDQTRRDCFGACWAIASAERGSLLALFAQLQLAATALAGTRLDPRPYLTGPASVISSLRLGN